MDGCVETLVTAGGWLGEEGSKDDLMVGRIIAPSLLLSAEAGISARSAEDERRTFLGNESWRFICPCLVSKVTIQAKLQIFRWSGQSGTKGTNTMTRTGIMTTIYTTWLISTKLVEACSSRGFFLAVPRQQVWSYVKTVDVAEIYVDVCQDTMWHPSRQESRP